MALEHQLVPIYFNQGVDTKTDPKMVLPGKLLALENGVFFKAGQIKKRYGYEHLGQSIVGSGSIASGSALSVYGDELLVFDDLRMYSYASTNDAWIDKGNAVSFKVENKQVAKNNKTLWDADYTYNQGIGVYIWRDATGIRCSVVDEETGVFYQNDVLLSATGTISKTVKIGDYLYVCYNEGANLQVRRVRRTNPRTFDAAVTLVSDLASTAPLFDFVPYNSSGCAFVYNTTTSVKVGYMTATPLLGAPSLGFADVIEVVEVATNCLTLVVGVGGLFVTYHNGSDGLRCFGRNTDLTVLFAPVTVDATTSPVYRNVTGEVQSATQLKLFYESDATSTVNAFVKTNTVDTSTGTAGTAVVFKRSVGLASKAWSHQGNVYVSLVHGSTLQSTYFTFNHSGSCVGKTLPNVAGGLTSGTLLPQVNTIQSGTFTWANINKTRLASEDNNVFSLKGVNRSKDDFTFNSRFSSADLGKNSHIVGGVLQSYDGNALVESGFNLFPEGITYTSGANGSLASGTYLYSALYEWTDAQGQAHRSAPSVPVTVYITGASNVNLTIPTLRLTDKQNVSIGVYRTETLGTVYYRVNHISGTDNTTSADSVTYNDRLADASITSNELLYTNGNVLDNISPPACSAITTHKNRLFLVSSENPNIIYFSKEHTEDLGAQFNDALFLKADKPIKALYSLDQSLVLFGESTIYTVVGDGPNNLGVPADGFSKPTLLSSDVGAVDQCTVVMMPKGLMFKSNKGIYLLDRSGQVSYIGAPVEQWNSYAVTSGVLVEDRNQVRFTLDGGPCLVYDYFFEQWSTFTNYAASDGVSWQGNYMHLKSTGIVGREVVDQYVDNVSNVKLRLETAWIKMNTLQGFQRVYSLRLLGNYASEHILQSKIFYDYQDYYADSCLFYTSGTLASDVYGSVSPYGSSGSVYGGTDSVYQFKHFPTTQQCQAVKFIFEDVISGTPGESFSINEVALDVGIKKGGFGLPPSKTI